MSMVLKLSDKYLYKFTKNLYHLDESPNFLAELKSLNISFRSNFILFALLNDDGGVSESSQLGVLHNISFVFILIVGGF